jgi:hypothetical protein
MKILFSCDDSKCTQYPTWRFTVERQSQPIGGFFLSHRINAADYGVDSTATSHRRDCSEEQC